METENTVINSKESVITFITNEIEKNHSRLDEISIELKKLDNEAREVTSNIHTYENTLTALKGEKRTPGRKKGHHAMLSENKSKQEESENQSEKPENEENSEIANLIYDFLKDKPNGMSMKSIATELANNHEKLYDKEIGEDWPRNLFNELKAHPHMFRIIKGKDNKDWVLNLNPSSNPTQSAHA